MSEMVVAFGVGVEVGVGLGVDVGVGVGVGTVPVAPGAAITGFCEAAFPAHPPTKMEANKTTLTATKSLSSFIQVNFLLSGANVLHIVNVSSADAGFFRCLVKQD
jgi:hypothetical protein